MMRPHFAARPVKATGPGGYNPGAVSPPSGAGTAPGVPYPPVGRTGGNHRRPVWARVTRRSVAWTEDAACTSEDPEVFFAYLGEVTNYARSVCMRCPVRETCLTTALLNGDTYGVRGGLHEGERVRMHRAVEGGADPHQLAAQAMPTKVCRRCSQEMPLIAFEKDASFRDGRKATCRECRRTPGRRRAA